MQIALLCLSSSCLMPDVVRLLVLVSLSALRFAFAVVVPHSPSFAIIISMSMAFVVVDGIVSFTRRQCLFPYISEAMAIQKKSIYEPGASRQPTISLIVAK